MGDVNMAEALQTLTIDAEFRTLIPALSKDERAQLEASVLAEGCRDALVVWQGILLDGHNRYEICTAHGIPFDTLDIDLPDRDAAITWIINNQLGRRNLTPEQASYLRGQRYNREKRQDGGHGDQKSGDQNDTPNTAAKLANEYKVSEPTIKRDGQFAQAVDALGETLGEEVKQEILSRDFNASKKEVQKLAREEPEVQRSTIEIMKADGVGITEAKRRAKGAQIAKREAVLPSGKYRVLYADPPWSYGNTQPDYHPEQRDHYPVMSLEELCAMPIKDIAMDNAVLFLWVTSPILEESFQLIKAWGFQYKASFVWDKVKHNMGHYNSVRHEFLLICTRGSCQPDVRKLFDSVVSEERTEHSRKPELFYKIIETLYTSGPYLELFARYKRDGWAAYGNES